MRRMFALLWVSAAWGCGGEPPAGDDDAQPSLEAGSNPDARVAADRVEPDAADAGTDATPAADATVLGDAGFIDAGPLTHGRGFDVTYPWAAFYGPATAIDIDRVSTTFKVVVIDADPDTGNFADDQLVQLKGRGSNRVLSYLDVGTCERFRSYYSTEPTGFRSCQSSGALTGTVTGHPDERWANLGSRDYRELIVNALAPRLASRPIDGFFLGHLEVLEHGAMGEGPCDASCVQGGLDLVWELRQRFPDHLIVIQNASSDLTRLGTTNGVPFPTLLDGLSHQEIYSPRLNIPGRSEMFAWRDMHLSVNGRAFWLGVEEFTGFCSAAAKPLRNSYDAIAQQDLLWPYITDSHDRQVGPCFWDDF